MKIRQNESFASFKHEGASPRVFVKRDGASGGGGGANRGGIDGDGGTLVVLVATAASQGNDRKQLKGGESKSRTSSTRQPHASSPPGPFTLADGHVHLGQLASGRQEVRIVY